MEREGERERVRERARERERVIERERYNFIKINRNMIMLQ